MPQFEILFGVKALEIKKNCILMPLINKNTIKYFNIEKLVRGKLFGVGQSENFTIIHTGMGHTFVGDTVLYLKQTSCENIILFGSCGLVAGENNLTIGSLVAPNICYANESFSDMLYEPDKNLKIFYPHKDFFDDFLKFDSKIQIEKVTCLTVSSLKLEEENQGKFKEKGIDIVDMECSAFFAATKFIRLQAAALFYVNDIIKDKPFYINPELNIKVKIEASIFTAINLLHKFFG